MEKLDLLKEFLVTWWQQLQALFATHFVPWTKTLVSGDVHEWLATAGTGFALITAAEIGDKSQLVCMTLAARHRGWPVLFGAISAFALLNLLAVLFGAMVATWIPQNVVAFAVALLFAVFGIHALLTKEEEEEDVEAVVEKSGHSIFLTTFLLIFIAEFGDKTQIAVAGLSSTALPASVWVGATLALAMTSAIGIWAGRTILQRFSMTLLHRIGGVLFLSLSAFAGIEAVSLTDFADWLGDASTEPLSAHPPR